MEEERAVRRDEKKPLGKKKKEGWVGRGGGWRRVVVERVGEGGLTTHRGDGRKEEDDEEG